MADVLILLFKMNNDENNSQLDTEQGSDKLIPTLELPSLTFGELGEKEKLRYAYLHRFFGNNAIQLVPLLGRKSDNTWDGIVRKIALLDTAVTSDLRYYDALYDAFEIGQPYSLHAVTEIVEQVRSNLNLPSYGAKKEGRAVRDLYRLYAVVTEHDEKGELCFIPVFKLMPDNIGIDE